MKNRKPTRAITISQIIVYTPPKVIGSVINPILLAIENTAKTSTITSIAIKTSLLVCEPQNIVNSMNKSIKTIRTARGAVNISATFVCVNVSRNVYIKFINKLFSFQKFIKYYIEV